MQWVAVIPAAGEGRRFGDAAQPKLLTPIAGKPLLARTLQALFGVPDLQRVFLAVHPKMQRQIHLQVVDRLEERLKQRIVMIEGGAQRGDSVYQGLQAVCQMDCAAEMLVAIHDGARPLVRPALLSALLDTAKEVGAAVPGFPVRDTVKVCRDSSAQVDSTVDRSSFWVVQTPQVFQFGIIEPAYRSAMMAKYYGTDDAALVERMGGRVEIIRGDPANIKLTYPEDREMVEMLLERDYV